MYPSYLIHFNRIHDPKTGKFFYGDGDGDGIANDHAHASKKDGMISRIGSSQKTSSGPSSSGSKALSTPYKKKSDYSLRDEHRQVLNNVKETAGPNTNTSSKTWVNSNRNNYVDEQKVSNVQAGNIYTTRTMGLALYDLYEDEEEKKRKKMKNSSIIKAGPHRPGPKHNENSREDRAPRNNKRNGEISYKKV